MKNRWIFLLMALLLSFSGVAQNSYILPVGNGTTTQNSVPSYMYYGNSVTQAIYHQSDINLSGEITSISWHPTGSSWGTRTWAVYLGETALDLFSGQSDLLTAEQLTEVYNGSVTTGADGWITIQLTTPFTYSNESNLVIAVFDNTNSWTSSYPNYTSTTFSSGISYYAYRDNTPYTSPTDANNARSSVPNIRLGITSNDEYCEAPSTISLASAEEESLTITWNALDAASGYVAQCKLPSETWEDAVEEAVTDNEATFSGLSANTVYEVRVQNNCGSAWISGSFRTACGAIATLPWFEDFESYVGGGQLSFECWEAPVAPNGPFVYAGHSPSCHSGSNSAEFKGTSNVLVMPAFEEDIHNLRLTFWTTATSPSIGSVEVGIMTDPTDVNTFELVGTCQTPASRGGSGSTGNGNIQGPFDFNLVEAESGRIALRYTSTDSYASWNLDDFTVDYIPACAEPTGLTVSNVAGHSAQLSWNSAEESFVVAYKANADEDWITVEGVTENPYTLEGLAPETSYTVKVGIACDDGTTSYSYTQTFTTTIACPAPTISAAALTNSVVLTWNGDAESYTVKLRQSGTTEWDVEETVYENTITIEELSASTNYEVQVIANCGEEDGESQPGTKTFATACDVVASFPYMEGFENGINCWTLEQLAGSATWSTSTSYKHSGSNSMYFPYTTGASARLVSPVFDLSSMSNPMLTYYYYIRPYSNEGDSLAVYYRASAEEEWTLLGGTRTPNSSSLEEVTYTLPNPSETYQISFVGIGYNAYGMYVDDVMIGETPTCDAPSSLTATGATETSIDLSWEGNVDSYTVYYKANGETEYSTQEATLDENGVYTLTDLTSSTSYTWYVASNCDDGTQNPAEAPITTHSFHTACDVVTELPYIMTFDDQYGTECMESALTSTYTSDGRVFPLTTLASSISHNGSAGAMEFMSGNIVTAFPAIEEDITSLRLKFFARCGVSENNAGTVEVGYMTDVYDQTTFVPLDTVPFTGQGQYIMCAYSYAAAEPGSRMAMRYTSVYTTTSWYFDDVEIDYLPSCPGPNYTSLTASVSYDEEYHANLTWTDASNSAWRVYYKQSTEEDYQSLDVTEMSASIAVNPSSTYSFYVVALCGETESADATSVVSLNIPGLPLESLPYEQDFENPEEITEFTITGSGSNQWAIGDNAFYSADGEETGHSLYISNDNGVTNAYTNSNTSLSYATLIVPFNEQLEYHLSFDFKCVAESGSYDYMKVFMLDADQELSTSTIPSNGAITPNLNMVSNWTHYDYTLTGIQAGSVKKIVFAWKNDSYLGDNPPAAIDNISIVGNACAKVTNITLASAEEDAITATWQENGSATSWNVYYRQHGTGEYTMETVNDNQATFTNLEANTSYDVYVEAICEDGSLAAASDVTTLRTACGAIATLPWNEDFESYTGDGAVALQCWTNITSYTANNGTFPAVYVGYSGSCHSGQNSMELKGASNLVALPPFTEPIENLRVSFYANTTASSASSAGTLEIGVISDLSDLSSFVVLDTVTGEAFNRNGSNPVGPFDFNTMESIPEGALIALRYNNASNSSESWNLDDFTVTLIPSCAAPNTPTVDDITSTSATINWTDDNTEHNAWKLYYKSAAESEYTEVSVSGTTTWTLTDLSASTQYSVYLMSDCGTADNIDVTATITFATACGDVTLFPYTEGFEGGDLGCWTTEAVVGSTPWTYSSSQYNSGSHSVYFTYTTNTSARLISPVFDLTSLEYPTLSYAYYVRDYAGSGDSLGVYYRTSAEDEWTFLGGHGDPMSGFAVDTIALPNPSATYQVMFLSLGRNANGMFLDDITVFEGEDSGEQPEVVAPQVATLAATQVAQTSAVLNGTITPGTETISAQGFEYKEATAANYTTVSATGNTMTATLNNLAANTTYEYRAYATTATSTYYGSVMTFTTLTEGGEPCTPTSSTTEATICEGSSYTFNGQTYTTAGTYTATLVNAAGCDSTATLVLTVNAASTSSLEASICAGETYEFNGQTLTTAGTYTATLQNVNGCDSVVTLTLTVNVAENTQDSVSINAGETYEWNGETYSQAGTYTAEMTDANGCSYTATLVLTVNNGLTDADNLVNVTLYPNPTTSNATLNVEGVNEEAMVIVTDIQGRTIQSNKLAAGQTTMTISTESLASGVYYVRVITSNATRTEKLIKK